MCGLLQNLKMLLSEMLFLFARSRLGGTIVGWSFAHMSWIIPVDKLYETDRVVAFHHPKPSHPVHVLIVPKKPIESVLSIGDDDTGYVTEVISAAQHIVRILELEESGFRLIVNGGHYQDVRQVHFHLVSGDALGGRQYEDP